MVKNFPKPQTMILQMIMLTGVPGTLVKETKEKKF